MTPMTIHDWERTQLTAGRQRISAKVDGVSIHYDLPDIIAASPRAESFLAPILLAAMADGRDIQVEAGIPLSPQLHARLPEIQRLFRQWAPSLSCIDVAAKLTAPATPNEMTVSLWSGGVDSMHSLARHRGDIGALLMANFFDYGRSPAADEKKTAALENICATTGKTPIFVASNIRQYLRETHAIEIIQSHGAIMCGLATSLGFDTLFFPSSFTYRELKPWGSHPLLDPLWSTETTRIIHDGADFRRTEKTVNVAKDPELLSRLQTCWKSGTANCGICSKCVRTKLVLDTIGVRGPYPDTRAADHLDKLAPSSDLDAAFLWDLIQFTRERGLSALEAQMSRLLSRYKRRRAIGGFLRAATGNWGRNLKRRLRPAGWERARVIFDDPDNF